MAVSIYTVVAIAPSSYANGMQIGLVIVEEVQEGGKLYRSDIGDRNDVK